MSKKSATAEQALIAFAQQAAAPRGGCVTLARKVGWDHGKVSRVLRGSQAMSLADAEALAAALGRRLEVR